LSKPRVIADAAQQGVPADRPPASLRAAGGRPLNFNVGQQEKDDER